MILGFSNKYLDLQNHDFRGLAPVRVKNFTESFHFGGEKIWVNESFDAREMESRWNLCASQLSGCSLNAEELAISKLGLPRPPRISEMSVEELDANEKQAFLNWRRMFVSDEDFSKVTEVRFSLVDGTGGIDYKRRVNESFDTREMESRWNLCASQLSGCSLNAEEFVISKLGLPRPPRISEMSVEELDANEKQAFLNWRRMFTGTAKTVTGYTTLDVKAERAEDVLTHQRYMLRPRRKWELKVLI
ncbi:hypothetical protein F2Q70_00029847 [Brassica cretica]|uniref:Uncharacterized protein n=1 Tax=Brassica cretica TaxID=69181 RepID=A0A8S9FTH0_BRACR|nr:hypothetical protein F2Q70_00029847 [Brassica cretica]